MLDFSSEDDAGDFDHHAEALLSTIVGERAELAAGDLRSLYIGWLAAYGAWERDEDAFDRDADNDLEPPVPSGLTTLTAAQQALADFLRLDEDVLAVAVQTSPPLKDVADDPGEVAAWVTRLPGQRIESPMLRRFNRSPTRSSIEHRLARARPSRPNATTPRRFGQWSALRMHRLRALMW